MEMQWKTKERNGGSKMKKKQRQRRRKKAKCNEEERKETELVKNGRAMQQHMTPIRNLRKKNTCNNTWSNQQSWKYDAEMPKKSINWTHVNSWSMGTIAFFIYISFIRLSIDIDN